MLGLSGEMLGQVRSGQVESGWVRKVRLDQVGSPGH